MTSSRKNPRSYICGKIFSSSFFNSSENFLKYAPNITPTIKITKNCEKFLADVKCE